MYKVTDSFVRADVVAAILNAEIHDKIISKSPVLNSELYSHICYMTLNSSKAYLSVYDSSDPNMVRDIRRMYEKYDIIDLTCTDAIDSYIAAMLRNASSTYQYSVSTATGTHTVNEIVLCDEFINNLSYIQQLVLSCLNPIKL